MLRPIFAALLAVSLSGCIIVYKLPTRQGNIIDQKQVDQLKLGMSQEQVRYLMGTPIATSPFETTRWEYFGYYKPPRGAPISRTVTLDFADNHLAKMEGIQMVGVDKNKVLTTTDVYSLSKDEKKESQKKEPEPAPPSTGINLPAPTP